MARGPFGGMRRQITPSCPSHSAHTPELRNGDSQVLRGWQLEMRERAHALPQQWIDSILFSRTHAGSVHIQNGTRASVAELVEMYNRVAPFSDSVGACASSQWGGRRLDAIATQTWWWPLPRCTLTLCSAMCQSR